MKLREVFRMNCAEATLLCEKRRESKLSIFERFGLWLHLAYCSFCRLFVRQSDIISEQIKKLDSPSLTLDTFKKEKIQKTLNQKINDNA